MPKQNVIVCVIYDSPNSDLNLSLEEINETVNIYLNKFPNEPFIIGGDFNGRVGCLNQIYKQVLFDDTCIYNKRNSFDETINVRGKVLINFMEELGLILINGRSFSDNPAQYTYLSNIGKSMIDLLWCNVAALELIKDFQVLNIITNSDHFPIILTFIDGITEYNMSRVHNNKLSWNDNNSNIFVNCMYFSDNVANLNVDVNIMHENLIYSITNSAKNANMFIKGLQAPIHIHTYIRKTLCHTFDR